MAETAERTFTSSPPERLFTSLPPLWLCLTMKNGRRDITSDTPTVSSGEKTLTPESSAALLLAGVW